MDDNERHVVLFEALHEGVVPPRAATSASAGADLSAWLRGRTVRCSDGDRQWETRCEDGDDAVLELAPGAMALVPLGFKARIPAGYEAQVRPWSGAAFRTGLHVPNAPGTIDADYPEEWMVIVQNGGAKPVTIQHGERIAQVVLSRHATLDWESGSVAVTTNRQGGFGSTGS